MSFFVASVGSSYWSLLFNLVSIGSFDALEVSRMGQVKP